MEQTAPILRIEKISLQDGSGLRTVVFFKGCPLHCAWCSTPESHSATPERAYQANKCTLCGRCVQACPSGALSFSPDKGLSWDSGKCTQCLRCAAACPTGATKVYGEYQTVAQVMRHIHRDEVFYFHSGGGVTLSGGDVLCYPDFAHALLTECKESLINTAAELTMYGDYDRIRQVYPLLNTALIDLKCMDSALHQKWTGQPNDGILQNIHRAAHEFPDVDIHIRVPLIWGVNDDPASIRQTAEFSASLPHCTALEFLPYHRLGQQTYAYLDRPYPLADLPTMTLPEARDKVACLSGRDWPFPVLISKEPAFPAS